MAYNCGYCNEELVVMVTTKHSKKSNTTYRLPYVYTAEGYSAKYSDSERLTIYLDTKKLLQEASRLLDTGL